MAPSGRMEEVKKLVFVKKVSLSITFQSFGCVSSSRLSVVFSWESPTSNQPKHEPPDEYLYFCSYSFWQLGPA